MSVIIAARNQAGTIGRSLDALLVGTRHDLEVFVVCNGCTDDTASVARDAVIGAHVIELGSPSRSAAVRAGNAIASAYPRVHLDADVEVSAASLAALREPIMDGTALATAPRRVILGVGCSLFVRWYYDVWEQLPQVRSGVFGRGVVVLSEEGQDRVSAIPEMIGDDVVMSALFDESERLVVEEAVVVVRPPRTTGDLVRRRTRVVIGNWQADAAGIRSNETTTSLRKLARLALAKPWLAPKIPIFLAVAVLARLRARRAVRHGDLALPGW
jgi:glycosyltransferase involved in cell wall biosynthesis